MNYTTITINGETIGLKFGMASLRYLTDKIVSGIAFENDDLNEIGISHILYGGYINNCYVKNEKPSYLFEQFVDWVESSLNNKDAMIEISNAISLWTQNEYIKQTQTQEDTKKKNSRGKK